MRFFIPVLAFCGAAMLVGCEKEEQPLELPPSEVQLNSVVDQVKMGSDYSTQIFYDFGSASAAGSSATASWDMAFDARAAGVGVWMNGGTDVAVFNTGLRNFANVSGLPQGFQPAQWAYDRPSGYADSTGVGEWRSAQNGASKTDVYIVRAGIQPRYKFQVLSCSQQKWTIAWGLLSSQQPFVVDIPKDTTRNYVYFSFRDAAIVQPEPSKAMWDVVFTRYRDFVPDNSGTLYPYVVNGALLNPANTEAAVDTGGYWENITAERARTLRFTTARNVIGYDWKTVGTTSGTPNGNYTVDSKKIYVIRTRAGKLYKLRFLDFYSPQGEKGSPKFEFQQLR